MTSQVFSITLLPCHKAMVRQAAWDSEAEDAKAPELQTVKLIAVEKFRQGSSGDGTLPLSYLKVMESNLSHIIHMYRPFLNGCSF